VKKIGIFTADLMTPAGPSRAACWIAERLSRRHEVWLISRDRPAIQSLIRRFGVSLADVRFLSLDVPGDRRASAWRSLTPSVLRRYWGTVNQFPAYRRLCKLKLDLFILNQSFHYMKNPAPRGIFMCMFPWPLPQFPHARWCRLPLVKPLINRALANTLNRFPDAPETYDVITANSHFTASWIKRLWNKDAPVIYSATELMPSPLSGRKEHIILTVGRYNWDKQQHILIEAFRGMPELHETGWELHLAGQTLPERTSRRYHDALQESARGYPVLFHYDLSLKELRQLYGRSAIYWHAKGFGVPEDEPHRMEHFGITPLEAMSAGCVPVVMDAGGLRETVQHGVNGLRWNTLDELRQQTLLLARNPELLAQFRARAVQVDSRFGMDPFLEAIDRLVEGVLAQA
jgi:glycosyltransferase involved in cell wall biosynthesis